MVLFESVSSILPARVTAPPKGFTKPTINRAKGPWLHLTNGQQIFDAASGSGSLVLGHSDDEISEVISGQTSQITAYSGNVFKCDIVEEYANSLTEKFLPSYKKIVFASSGSDAVETALKLSIQYHRFTGNSNKHKILGRKGSYHGNTLAGLEVAGFLGRKQPYLACLPQYTKASHASCFDCPFNLIPSTCDLECATSFEDAILAEGPETIAGIVVEPIVGAAYSGAVPDSRYFSEVRRICDKYDVLMIADEVLTGFGRTGRLLAMEHWDVKPDISITGKGMGAGHFPISAVLASKKISDAFSGGGYEFQNGQTFSLSPVGAAVGNNVVRRISGSSFLENVEVLGQKLIKELKESVLPEIVSDIRGRGLMIGILLNQSHKGLLDNPGYHIETLRNIAIENGLLIYPSHGSPESKFGNHCLLLPPLNIDATHIDFIVSRFSMSVQQYLEVNGYFHD